MKKKSFAVLLMIVALISAMFMTACGGSKTEESKEPPTLESFMNENPDVLKQIEDSMASGETEGVKISVSGNDLIYSYDIAGIQDVTEEFAKSEATKESLTQALEDQGENFRQVASSIETILNEAGVEISGVQVVVNYTYGDDVIATGTFKPDPAAEAAPAEGEEESAEAGDDSDDAGDSAD